MGRTFTTIIATALIALAPLAALAQVTPGTTLVGTFDTNLSSNHAQPGTPFTISNAHSSNYDINGATIYGHVASVQSAGQGRPAKSRWRSTRSTRRRATSIRSAVTPPTLT